jgi:hypothetical protein
MKTKIFFTSFLLVISISAHSSPEQPCGRSGEIIEVHETSPGVIGDIPPECRKGREENWFGAPPEAGMSKQEICDKTMAPFDEYTGRRMTGMKNMSACFCVVDHQFSSGIMTKCWTYFDRDRK